MPNADFKLLYFILWRLFKLKLIKVITVNGHWKKINKFTIQYNKFRLIDSDRVWEERNGVWIFHFQNFSSFLMAFFHNISYFLCGLWWFEFSVEYIEEIEKKENQQQLTAISMNFSMVQLKSLYGDFFLPFWDLSRVSSWKVKNYFLTSKLARHLTF